MIVQGILSLGSTDPWILDLEDCKSVSREAFHIVGR